MPAEPDPAQRGPRKAGDPVGRFAVVGGGVAGLVAARELALAGGEVALFERDDRLGGRIRSVVWDGLPGEAMPATDIGAEAFATRGGAVRELLEELGLAGEIVSPVARGSWLVAGRRATPLPAAGTLGIPTAPMSAESRRTLGVLGSLRAAIEPLLPRRIGVERGGSAGAPVTVGGLVRARLGSRALERLVRPVALGVHSADPDRLALDAVHGLSDALERTGSLIAAARELRGSHAAAGGAVAGLRGGMTPLIDALAAELERLGVQVSCGVTIEKMAGLERFDATILAVPEAAAQSILGVTRTGGPAAAQPSGIEIIALVLDDERLERAPRGTGALVAPSPATRPAVPSIRAKALTHVTAKWADRAAAFGHGRHVLRLSYGRAGSAPETAGLSDREVRDLALADASRILGVDLDPATLLGIARQSWPVGAPPDRARVDAMRAMLPPRVELAGDWVDGTGLASVIPGARRAARRLLQNTASPA